jgi:hypothetical protein
LNQSYTGRICYYADHQVGPHRLPVAVECVVGGLAFLTYALLDIASDWCVMSHDLAAALGLDLTPALATVPLHSRFGLTFGQMEREIVRLVADEGDDLEIEATWFVSADWDGPTVLGWKGCLERMRFAFDPRQGRNSFYFADAEEDAEESEPSIAG